MTSEIECANSYCIPAEKTKRKTGKGGKRESKRGNKTYPKDAGAEARFPTCPLCLYIPLLWIIAASFRGQLGIRQGSAGPKWTGLSLVMLDIVMEIALWIRCG